MDSLWKEFESENLRVLLKRSIATTSSSQDILPPLDLWRWSLIGLVCTNLIRVVCRCFCPGVSLPSYLLHAILLGTTGPYVMLLSHAPGI